MEKASTISAHAPQATSPKGALEMGESGTTLRIAGAGVPRLTSELGLLTAAWIDLESAIQPWHSIQDLDLALIVLDRSSSPLSEREMAAFTQKPERLPLVIWDRSSPVSRPEDAATGIPDPSANEQFERLAKAATLIAVGCEDRLDWWRTRSNAALIFVGSGVCLPLEQPEREDLHTSLELGPGSLTQARTALATRRETLLTNAPILHLSQIATSMGLDPGWTPFPPVTVVAPTFRPELIPGIVSQYRAQSYPNRELMIVAHGVHDLGSIRRTLGESARDGRGIDIAMVGSEYSVGHCLNLAADRASGDFCIKMDDDDVYSPDYLLDMMLPMRETPVDIFGKPPLFWHSGDRDQLFMRRAKAPWQWRTGTTTDLGLSHIRLTGSTLSARTEVFRHYRFPTTNVGNADTAFIHKIAGCPLRVGVRDGFGVITRRSKAKGRHTWRLDEATLIRDSMLVCDGDGTETAFLPPAFHRSDKEPHG